MLHFKIHRIVRSHNKTEALVEVDGWISAKDGETDRQAGGLGFTNETAKHISPEAAIAIFREKRDIDELDGGRAAGDDHASDWHALMEEDGILGAGIRCFVAAATDIELHAEEGFLLSGIPTVGFNFFAAGAGINLV
jgi:hypothetical protein